MSDLNTLFSKDPLELSEQNIDEIIAALREARVGQMQADAAAQASGKRTRGVGSEKKALSKDALANITIDDLLGGI